MDLELPFMTRDRATLADGRDALFDVYEAALLWEGEQAYVPVYASDATPLLGMSMLHGYSVYMEVVDGGRVTVQAGAR